jgi:hypothetical protein
MNMNYLIQPTEALESSLGLACGKIFTRQRQSGENEYQLVAGTLSLFLTHKHTQIHHT